MPYMLIEKKPRSATMSGETWVTIEALEKSYGEDGDRLIPAHVVFDRVGWPCWAVWPGDTQAPDNPLPRGEEVELIVDERIAVMLLIELHEGRGEIRFGY